ncbi:MAG: hypothetical protein KF716_08680 [Anaerolineae bacterium]|nr:hypothetical protein [Anaerolineae bacterium]
MDKYYATFSLPTIREGSFTVWTNLDGLRRELTFIPSLCWWEEGGQRDGENFCMIVTLEARCHYETVLRIIKDCVTVENMLELEILEGLEDL